MEKAEATPANNDELIDNQPPLFDLEGLTFDETLYLDGILQGIIAEMEEKRDKTLAT